MNKIGLSYDILKGALVLFLLVGCIPSATTVTTALPTTPSIASPSPNPSATGTPEPTQAVVAEHPRVIFTTNNLEPVSGRPSLRQDAIDPQMGNVLVPLVLSADQLKYLAESGVVASPADYPEFHVLYKETVRNNLPVFVTSDSLLHAYHLTFDQLLSSLEEEVFLPKLRELNQALLAQVQGEYEQAKGTAWEDAARHLYAYLAVGSKLANPEFQLPEVVKDLAQAELELIEAAFSRSDITTGSTPHAYPAQEI